MKPDELSETEKWARFHAAMDREREYIALDEERRLQREKTWRLIRWTMLFWLGFVLWAITTIPSEILRPLNEALQRL